jgi:methionyl-tRNA formyltransferase
MKMDAGIDTGPYLSRRILDILPDDTAGSLFPRLAQAGADLLIETLPGYLAGQLNPIPQDDSQATYAPMLKKEAGLLDVTRSVQDLSNQVRAFNPWPGAYFPWQDQPLKVHRAHLVIQTGVQPGQRTIIDNLPALAAAGGWLLLDEVQPAGKRAMTGKDFLAGARRWTD